MTKEELHRWRLVIPGILFLLELAPLCIIYYGFDCIADYNNIWKIAYVFIAIPYSVFYNAFRIRDKFLPLEDIWSNVNINIKRRLINMTKEETVQSKSEDLISGKWLMDIFYKLVDSDNTLIERKKKIYMNGLLISSIADFICVSIFMTTVYIITYIIELNIKYLIVAVILILFSFFMKIPLNKLSEKHIELSNDQLDFISLHYSDVVRKKLHKLATEE